MLGVVVRADGSAGDVQVKESLDAVYGLDQEAIRAMKQWEFKPGMKDGRAVAVRVDVKIRFTLR
jgi:TonB family protein